MWLIVQPPHGQLNHCVQPGAERTPCGLEAKRWQIVHPALGGDGRPGCKRCRAAFDAAASMTLRFSDLPAVEAWFKEQFKLLRSDNYEVRQAILLEAQRIVGELLQANRTLISVRKLLAREVPDRRGFLRR